MNDGDEFSPEVEAGIESITEQIELDITGRSSDLITKVIRMAYSAGWENGYESAKQ